MAILRRFQGYVTAIVLLLTIVSATQAKYSGGTGEPNDPYQITTAADLIALGETPEDYDKHFILTADIDLDPNLPGRKVFDRAVIAPDTNPNDKWGDFQGTPFTGIFDGNSHTISHIAIRGSDYLGLFGLSSGALVKELGVVNLSITGLGRHIGGLAGQNSGEVTNCYSNGTVTGYRDVGGLVGINAGSISSSYSSGSVSGTDHVGGLVGDNRSGTVTQCFSTGTVSGVYGYIGGLVGDNYGGYITMSFSNGSVSGRNYVGGLVGWNSGGEATNCYSTGTVSGDSSVGGLVGNNFWSDMWGTDPGIVAHCYSTGIVNGAGENVGGLVGSDDGWSLEGFVSDSFWDTQTSGQSTSDGGTGLTTAEMQTASTFTSWGTCGNEGVWTIDEGKDYPRLWWENKHGEAISSPPLTDFLTGTGTESDPFLIYTPEELNMVGLFPCEFDRHFKLMADIDMSGFDGIDGRPAFNIIGHCFLQPSGWSVVPPSLGGAPFTGVFAGNGHTISNLTVVGNSYVGLFGGLESQAEVKNLGLVDVNVSGFGNCVGGLVGYNKGNVTGCYSTGSVSGRTYVGGLVGTNGSSSSQGVRNCYSTSSVSGTYCAGGLVGDNYSRIATSYGTGVVVGEGYVGGLVGQDYNTVTYSYWDIETSGQTLTYSSGGIGLTTVQMQSFDTFLEWGSCGNEGVWTIDEGKDYPRLSWENKSGRPIESKLSDFLAGEGTQASPYLVYTLQDSNLISRFPCDQDKHFRLMFLAGEGTQENPYLISTAEELNVLGRCPFNLNMCFRLMADISLLDFDGKEGRLAFKSIGTYGQGFAGVFDGNGHTISHLTIPDGDYPTGLFSRLASGGEILDLGVVDVNIGTSTRSYVGGLVGSNSGTVVSCYSTGSIAGYSSRVGGLVGYNTGIVASCYSTGSIAVDASYVGGLVGHNTGIVASCYSIGAVSGLGEIGGLVGRNRRGSVTDCYSTGTVNGNRRVGGLVGYNYEDGSINQSYSTGLVMCNGNDVGGLVGQNEGDVVICFWDIQTSGQIASAAGTGKITAQMQTASTFLEAGWDFMGETANGTEDIWWILEGQDYPRLWWESTEQ